MRSIPASLNFINNEDSSCGSISYLGTLGVGRDMDLRVPPAPAQNAQGLERILSPGIRLKKNNDKVFIGFSMIEGNKAQMCALLGLKAVCCVLKYYSLSEIVLAMYAKKGIWESKTDKHQNMQF